MNGKGHWHSITTTIIVKLTLCQGGCIAELSRRSTPHRPVLRKWPRGKTFLKNPHSPIFTFLHECQVNISGLVASGKTHTWNLAGLRCHWPQSRVSSGWQFTLRFLDIKHRWSPKGATLDLSFKTSGSCWRGWSLPSLLLWKNPSPSNWGCSSPWRKRWVTVW